jgi:hypothetical protein
VKYIDKLKALSREKKFIILFIVICCAIPFSIARSPLEVISHSVPLFVYFHVEVGHWLASGKPFWQVALACYGVSSAELLGWYLGGFGVRILFEKITKKLRKGVKIPFGNQLLPLRERKEYKRLNSFARRSKENFAGWLKKQSIWIIFFFLLLPLPFTDIAAAVALGTKKIKYGHWYLVAINLPHIFLVVYLLRLGVDLFFF